MSDPTALIEELEAEYGESLRALATYDRSGYELHYLSERTDRNYSLDDIEEIYDDVVLQDVEHGFHEELFDDMGEILGKVRLFEDGVVAHFWPTDDDDGVFMTFDASADVSVWSLYDFAERYYG